MSHLMYFSLAQAERISQSWDTGIKSSAHHDPSVCITFAEAEGVHYVLDVEVLRAEYPALKRALLRLAEQWKPHAILVEDKASGQSLLQDVRREQPQLPLLAMMPQGDKLTRFARVTPLLEAGKMALPREATWLAAFEQELLGFPHGAHDDQVDALSQYLNWVRERSGGGVRLRVL